MSGANGMRGAVEIADGVRVGDGSLALLAGPCVIESAELLHEVAEELQRASVRHGVPLVFKASFDKANRTSGSSFRSLGFDRALQALAEVKDRHGLPVMTDVHEPWQVERVA